jgi:hypothetical protein
MSGSAFVAFRLKGRLHGARPPVAVVAPGEVLTEEIVKVSQELRGNGVRIK